MRPTSNSSLSRGDLRSALPRRRQTGRRRRPVGAPPAPRRARARGSGHPPRRRRRPGRPRRRPARPGRPRRRPTAGRPPTGRRAGADLGPLAGLDVERARGLVVQPHHPVAAEDLDPPGRAPAQDVVPDAGQLRLEPRGEGQGHRGQVLDPLVPGVVRRPRDDRATSPKQNRRMSTSWMECSIRQPPPACAASARHCEA